MNTPTETKPVNRATVLRKAHERAVAALQALYQEALRDCTNAEISDDLYAAFDE